MKKTKFSKSVILFALMLCLLAVSAHALPSIATAGDDIREQEALKTPDTEECGVYSLSKEEIIYVTSFIPETGGETESIYEYLAKGIINHEDKIDISSFKFKLKDKLEVYQYLLRIRLMYPETYDFDIEGTTLDYDVGYYTTISPAYYEDKDFKATRNKITAKIDEIISYTNTEMSRLEKILTVHDRIVLSCKYDKINRKNTAKDLFLYGESMCEGYASAFYAIMAKLEIPCGFVNYPPSKEKDTEGHIWNIVKLDDEWYHVDTTWDDPSNVCNPTFVDHSHFLKSTSFMIEADDEGKYPETLDCPVELNSEKYDNYFWNNVKSQIVSADDKLYFVDWKKTNSSSIYKSEFFISCYDIEKNTTENLVPLGLWIIEQYDNAYRAYTSAFSGLELRNDRLYFNTEKELKSCKLDGTDIKTVYTVTEDKWEDFRIVGCGFDDDELYYVLCEIGVNHPYFVGEKDFVNIKGDINLDGVLDEKDAILLFRHSVFPHIYPTEYVGSMDFDKNGCLDIADTKALLEYIEERKQ